jgi:MarR-like DNA-binding transcriptional regulator SgrR of sgrS sRNA
MFGAARPAHLFASINRIDVTHAQCLTITLHRPDYWLPFRLASYCSVLAHPDDPAVGSGPFRLKLFSPELVRLENHPRYHLHHPLIQAVEYWITPQLFEQNLGTSCRHPVQITIGDRTSWQICVRSATASASGFAI